MADGWIDLARKWETGRRVAAAVSVARVNDIHELSPIWIKPNIFLLKKKTKK